MTRLDDTLGPRPTRRAYLRWQAAVLGALGFGLPNGLLAGVVLPARPWTGGPFDVDRPRAPRELIAAVQAGDEARVGEILARAPTLAAARDADGRSMFVLAHLFDRPRVAALLKERNLELDLVEAILDGDSDEIMRLAGELPATVNAFHPIGATPYGTAGRFGRPQAVFPLDRWGGDPNLNPLGAGSVTAARAALDYPDKRAAYQTAIRILSNSGDVNAPQRDGDSILHGAARHGDPILVRFVVRRGADVGARNAAGQTALDVAIASGNARAADVLRDSGAIERAVFSSRTSYAMQGREPASAKVDPRTDQLVINEFAAVCHRDFDRVREILAAHPTVVHGNSSWNEMGIEANAHMGRSDMADYLLERNAPLSLPTAIMLNLAGESRRLLAEDPARVAERGAHDFPLMWYPSIGGGSVEMAELLLEHGADVDQDKLGVGCLHLAARKGQLELAAFLIERGADLEQYGKPEFGPLEGTPLAFAEAHEQTEAIRLLRAAGADAATRHVRADQADTR